MKPKKNLTKVPIVYPKSNEREVLKSLKDCRRITLQFRCYGPDGKYDLSKKVSTTSWHFRGVTSVKDAEKMLERAVRKAKGIVIARTAAA